MELKSRINFEVLDSDVDEKNPAGTFPEKIWFDLHGKLVLFAVF